MVAGQPVNINIVQKIKEGERERMCVRERKRERTDAAKIQDNEIYGGPKITVS